jgi:hypothetical protein
LAGARDDGRQLVEVGHRPGDRGGKLGRLYTPALNWELEHTVEPEAALRYRCLANLGELTGLLAEIG